MHLSCLKSNYIKNFVDSNVLFVKNILFELELKYNKSAFTLNLFKNNKLFSYK